MAQFRVGEFLPGFNQSLACVSHGWWPGSAGLVLAKHGSCARNAACHRNWADSFNPADVAGNDYESLVDPDWNFSVPGCATGGALRHIPVGAGKGPAGRRD